MTRAVVLRRAVDGFPDLHGDCRMCGIAGIYDCARTVEMEPLERMAQQLSHRGPDATTVYRRSDIGLAHTRLSIIDLLGGGQPFKSAGDDLVVIANGEIYNYIELRQELRARGCRFGTDSDCETILHLYAEYGIDGFRRLHGMFAFALFDRRAQRLVLARDRLGIKPLFLTRSGSAWMFASEIKGLLPCLKRAPSVDAFALAQYLHAGYVSDPDTLLQGIQSLPPGCIAIIGADGTMRQERYWDLNAVEPFTGTEGEAQEQFSQIFDETMREHVRADVPYGLFLSGGVDSGTLASVFSERGVESFNTFAIGFPGTHRHNELDAAEWVARRFGFAHHRIEVAPQELEQRVAEAVWAADSLIFDPALLPTLILAEAAARELKVVFTGEGGDEVFAGYGRYRVQSPGRRLAALLDRRGGGLQLKSRWSTQAARLCFGDELNAGSHQRRIAVCRAWTRTKRHWGHIRRRQYVDFQTGLPDELLVKVDRALMAYGVEGRVPYLDHRIVEFGFSLPDEMKIVRRQRKVFLKRWAEQHLPKDHLYAKKRGFYVPIGGMFSAALLEQLQRLLPEAPAVREWFRPDGVSQLLRRQMEKGDVAEEVWSLVLFCLWHRLFVEGRCARPERDVPLADIIGADTREPTVLPLRPPAPHQAAVVEGSKTIN